MGGPGSGNRWGRWPTKRRVEECESIDTAYLRLQGWLRPGAVTAGTLSWASNWGKGSTIGCTADLSTPQDPVVRVSYTLSGELIAYRIALTTTRPQYGGMRWWFLCPLVVRGVPCRRRVRKVYRVGKYFGCRHCHDLTYRSRQEHDPRVSRLMKNSALIRAMMESGDARHSLLAIKAALSLAQLRKFSDRLEESPVPNAPDLRRFSP